MPFPAPGTLWPPPLWQPAFARHSLNEALWLNDTELLSSLLAAGTDAAYRTQRARGLSTMGSLLSRLGVNLNRRWAWSNLAPYNERRTDLPIPIGRSIAELSAAQLMSEPPTFRYVTRDQATGKVSTLGGDQQDRLDLIAASDDARATLLEGAQIASALGGVVFKAQWDLDDPDRDSVWYDAVGIDCALPHWNTAGRLDEVILWTQYPGPGATVYRHFERHAPGLIEHALYRGTLRQIGTIVKLDTIDATAGLLALKDTTVEEGILSIPTGVARLTATVWKNRPAIALRKNGELRDLGRSDFEGIEPLLDAYSEAWGSMMRDVRLGKARMLVPTGALDDTATANGGPRFDPDREFYQQIGVLDPESPASAFQLVQANIRWQEHLNTLAGIKREILDGAGWSLSSYGNTSVPGDGGSAVTATEVIDRTTKSERTRDEKSLYFRKDFQPFIRMLAELDSILYPGRGLGNLDEELTIAFPDVSQVDPQKQAETFLSLRQANAISIEETVRERRPDWDDTEVDEEVSRIMHDIDELRGGVATDPSTLGRVDLTDPANPDDPNPDPSAPSPADGAEPPADPTRDATAAR